MTRLLFRALIPRPASSTLPGLGLVWVLPPPRSPIGVAVARLISLQSGPLNSSSSREASTFPTLVPPSSMSLQPPHPLALRSIFSGEVEGVLGAQPNPTLISTLKLLRRAAVAVCLSVRGFSEPSLRSPVPLLSSPITSITPTITPISPDLAQSPPPVSL